jgi:hypothetical protein
LVVLTESNSFFNIQLQLQRRDSQEIENTNKYLVDTPVLQRTKDSLKDLLLFLSSAAAADLRSFTHHKHQTGKTMVKLLHVLMGALWAFHRHVHAFSPATRSLAIPSTTKKTQLFSAVVEDTTAALFEKEQFQANILGDPIPYEELTIGVMKETYKGENRVSQTPDSVKMLVKAGFNVVVQAGGEFE